jgi:hypothetical protein
MQDENVSMWHYMSADHGKLAETCKTCKKLQKLAKTCKKLQKKKCDPFLPFFSHQFLLHRFGLTPAVDDKHPLQGARIEK